MLHGKEYFPFKGAFVMKLDIDFAALKVVHFKYTSKLHYSSRLNKWLFIQNIIFINVNTQYKNYQEKKPKQTERADTYHVPPEGGCLSFPSQNLPSHF